MAVLLLTGFGDYEKNGIIIRNNPSQIAVEKFIEKHPFIEKYEVIGGILDAANRDGAGCQIVELLENYRPAVCLSLGMKTIGTESLLFESQAMDIHGRGQNIISKMNMSIIVVECNKIGLRSQTSFDAGNGVCNHIYYTGIEHIRANQLSTIMGFVHLPLLNDTVLMGKPRTSEMSLDYIHRAISITFSHTLRNIVAGDN